jgi:secondary thiamine-phosphate synthase enzyme
MGWYREFSYSGSAGTDIHDLTGDIREALAGWNVSEGIAVVFTPGSTASVTTIEYEPGVLDDLRRAIERIAPTALNYAHNAAWGDGNGYSHVRSALLGPSVAIPVHGGDLVLGTWQQVVLLDFDNRPRKRRVVLMVHGE